MLVILGTALGGSLEHRSANADDCAKVFKGCRVKAGECLCGQKQACSNPFPYRNEHQCFKDLRGMMEPPQTQISNCMNICDEDMCLLSLPLILSGVLYYYPGASGSLTYCGSLAKSIFDLMLEHDNAYHMYHDVVIHVIYV